MTKSTILEPISTIKSSKRKARQGCIRLVDGFWVERNPKSQPIEKKMMVQTYYRKMPNGQVIQFEKIGDGEWLSAVTPYDDLPYKELLIRPYLPSPIVSDKLKKHDKIK